ncbi:hypothetical protein GCM10023149_48610 [Mucilaginibacter gynuensis]|uniref:Uncharacterized protein n=1 Tax=Mucilaginibacter gynuensis TaxID=1302236 RepID=A0ABP8HFH4_9SPHI
MKLYKLIINEAGIMQVINQHGEVVPALKGTTIAKSLDTSKGFSEVTITLLCKNESTKNSTEYK